MAKEHKKYFGEKKKEHSKIKHNICCGTLKGSISIANLLAKSEDKYIYIDLFAGAGKFKNDEKGSILLALDIILNHLNYVKGTVKNNLTFKALAIEKDKITYENLKKNVASYENKGINIEVLYGDWENFKEKILKELKINKWGFIFADPFATELNLKELVEIIKQSKFQDFLIFLNFNKVYRDLGKEEISKEEKKKIKNNLKKFLLLEDEELEIIYSKKDKDIINLFKDKLKELKDFIIGVAIPVEAGGTIRHGDFYYLFLLTNSIGVVELFLENYVGEVNKYAIQMQLWESFSIEDEINKMDKKFSLYELWERLIDKVISWKESKKFIKDIPTRRNIISVLNKMKRNGNLKFIADKNYYYLRKGKYGNKGELNPDKIKSKKALKEIFILRKQKGLFL